MPHVKTYAENNSGKKRNLPKAPKMKNKMKSKYYY